MIALINHKFNSSILQKYPTLDSDALVPNTVQFPIYHIARVSIVPGIDDKALSLLSPILAYWVLSLCFHLLDSKIFRWPAKYRIHESEEVTSKNLASRKDVILAVIFQQVVQTLLGIVWLDDDESDAFRNHTGEMRHLSQWVARFVVTILGDKRGGDLLATQGQKLVSWLYWWGIPVAQYIWAMCVVLSRPPSPLMPLPVSSSTLGSTSSTAHFT